MRPLFLISDSSKHDLRKLKKFILPPCRIKTHKITTQLKSILNQEKPAIFILNSSFSKQKIIQCVSFIKAVSPHTRILLLIRQNEIALGKESIQWGIHAYLITPFRDIDLVKRLIKNALCEWEFLQKASKLLSLVKKKDIELNLPRTINTHICSHIEIRDIVTAVKIKMSQLFDYTALLILILNETKPKLYILQNYAIDSQFINQAVHNIFQISSDTSGKGVSIKDIEQIIENPVTIDAPTRTKPLSIQSTITLPLVANGEDFGYASMISHKPHAFRDEDFQHFFPVCYSLAIALRNARLFQSTKELSITDSLTRIYNRHYFDDVMEKEFLRAQRYKHPLSLAIIDIDNFKEINDTYGHTEGDKVLRQFASKVKETIRNTDIFSRYGGEEFSVIMPLTDIEEGIVVMERLRVVIAGSIFPITNKNIQLTASIGVSSLFDNPIHSAKELIQEADSALYLAKKAGKNRAYIYTSEKTGINSNADISSEKRVLRRVDARFPLKYLVLPKMDEYRRRAVTQNISISGLCFESDRDTLVTQGTYAMVEVNLSKKKTAAKKLKMLYQIVWSVEKDDKQLVGAKLVSSSKEVVDILAKLLKGNPFQQQGIGHHRHRGKRHG